MAKEVRLTDDAMDAVHYVAAQMGVDDTKAARFLIELGLKMFMEQKQKDTGTGSQ